MNGHLKQNEAAANRDPMEAWRGIVALVEGGHSPIDVSGISRRRAIIAVNERLNALEAVAQQGNVGMVTDEEWRALSAESRHVINKYVMASIAANAAARKLAGMVLNYPESTTPSTVKAWCEIIYFARGIAGEDEARPAV